MNGLISIGELTASVLDADPKQEADDGKDLGGRPTLYRPEFADQAAKLCALGATDDELADFFGVTQRTINRWKITYPEFCQSIQQSKEECDAKIERSLFHRAAGHFIKEQQAFKVKQVDYAEGKRVKESEDIKVVEIDKYQPPDTAAQIFWLKNRRSKSWKDRYDHKHDHTLTLSQEFESFMRQVLTNDGHVEPKVIEHAPSQTQEMLPMPRDVSAE